MSVVVRDNFLDKEYFKELQSEVLGVSFPWFLSGILNTEPDNDYQMNHTVYRFDRSYSDFYSQLRPLFDAMDIFSLYRVKLNIQKREEKITEGGMHNDVMVAPKNALTSILYMNTNNGYTKLETGEKVESVENRLVTFPNSLKHTGSKNNCEELYRCVMNIGWIPKPNNNLIMEK